MKNQIFVPHNEGRKIVKQKENGRYKKKETITFFFVLVICCLFVGFSSQFLSTGNLERLIIFTGLYL